MIINLAKGFFEFSYLSLEDMLSVSTVYSHEHQILTITI